MDINKINRNIASNLDRISCEKYLTKAEFIKDLIEHFSSMDSQVTIGKETIYQMINGGRKSGRGNELIPVSFGIEKICAVCEYLNISIDGLISSNKPLSPDTNVQTICKYTGLDESAVNRLHSEIALPLALDSETLHDYKLNQSAQINNLISSQFFFELVRLFNDYLFSYKNEKDHLLKYLSALDKKYNKIKNIDDISSTDFKKLDEIDDKIGELIKERRLSLFELQEYMMEYAKTYSEPGEEEILSLEKAAKKRIDALFMIMGIANIDKEALAKILEKPRDNFDEVYAELTRSLEEKMEEKWRT